EAGVVDAGGRGYVVLLQALAHVLTGSRQPAPREPGSAMISAPAVARESGSLDFAYEVQYLLDAEPAAVEELRSQLVSLGDSVAIVGTGDGTWNVHVHVNDVGAALEAGMAAGRPHRVSVATFADQIQPTHRADGAVAVVAVAPGAGLAHLFAREGVDVVMSVEPSADDVLASLHLTAAHEVVVIATGAAATAAAETAAGLARQDGLRVAVVPTRSAVQALAAVAVHDRTRRFDDVVVSMAEAAAATRFAEVVIATEQALTAVGICEAGDVLGLIDGEVVEIGPGLLAVVLAIVDRLLGIGAELLTVVVGRDAPAGLGELLTSHIRDRARFTEVAVYAADQSEYPVIIGME
ncbi:MAG TPA: hypothetical protein VKQ07_07270, partial [Jatrophihabitantaceae bacterium]|nr:hypothetical protein [Jatrophihabitantaceae bacterium]